MWWRPCKLLELASEPFVLYTIKYVQIKSNQVHVKGSSVMRSYPLFFSYLYIYTSEKVFLHYYKKSCLNHKINLISINIKSIYIEFHYISFDLNHVISNLRHWMQYITWLQNCLIFSNSEKNSFEYWYLLCKFSTCEDITVIQWTKPGI